MRIPRIPYVILFQPFKRYPGLLLKMRYLAYLILFCFNLSRDTQDCYSIKTSKLISVTNFKCFKRIKSTILNLIL